MFARLYGETEEQQLQYLYPRVRITAILVLVILCCMVFGYLFKLDSLGMLAAAAYVFLIFYWGWPTIKAWFGIAAVGTLFARNIVFGSVIICFYGMLSILAGFVFLFLGVGRYLYLKHSAKKEA